MSQKKNVWKWNIEKHIKKVKNQVNKRKTSGFDSQTFSSYFILDNNPDIVVFIEPQLLFF